MGSYGGSDSLLNKAEFVRLVLWCLVSLQCQIVACFYIFYLLGDLLQIFKTHYKNDFFQ